MGWSAQVEEGSHSCQYLSTPQWRQILSQELPCTSHQQHQRQGLSQHLWRIIHRISTYRGQQSWWDQTQFHAQSREHQMHQWPAAPTPASCQGMLHNHIHRARARAGSRSGSSERALALDQDSWQSLWCSASLVHWRQLLLARSHHRGCDQHQFLSSYINFLNPKFTKSTSPMEVPVSVWINSNTMSSMTRLRTPGLPPHSVSFKRVRITIRVGWGEEVPVDLVQVVWVTVIALDQLIDNEGGHSRGDPLSSMDTSLQPYVRCTCTSLEFRI